MKPIKIFTAVILAVLALNNFLYPCTTAIISGKFTKDGRPLLLKHRDSGFIQNKLMYFSDGKYNYIGLVNSADSAGKEVWAGCNSAGFAIMNSASYNLKPPSDTTSIKDMEGVVMKLALRECATVRDFEQLLKSLPKPLGVEANFGVIDAEGGAAYFETDNFSFKKFDVNDPATAPHGYLIRTNFSFSGRKDEGYGYIRYATADELLREAESSDNLSAAYLIQSVSRSLKNSLTKNNLFSEYVKVNSSRHLVPFEDYIPRYISTTSVIIEGVKSGEPASHTTMWTILGFPLCSVAVPVWVEGGSALPEILTAQGHGNAKLCGLSLKLKDKCFPVKRGSGTKYMNISALVNNKGTGILQKLWPVEDKILSGAEDKLSEWRKSGFTEKAIRGYYSFINGFVLDSYKSLFNLD